MIRQSAGETAVGHGSRPIAGVWAASGVRPADCVVCRSFQTAIDGLPFALSLVLCMLRNSKQRSVTLLLPSGTPHVKGGESLDTADEV